jgi:hypothetical protein
MPVLVSQKTNCGTATAHLGDATTYSSPDGRVLFDHLFRTPGEIQDRDVVSRMRPARYFLDEDVGMKK